MAPLGLYPRRITNVILLVLGFLAAVQASTDDQVNAKIDYGTFENPSSIVRPRFRYWLPDSSVDADVVKADIKSSAAIGAGGVEFLPYFQYGGQMGTQPPGDDWVAGMFETEEFQKVLIAALEAHDEAGLQMDFALGPNQGQGVPANADDEGLQWDLVPFTEAVPSDGNFNGTIPGWGTGELVAFTSAEMISNVSETMVVQGLTGDSVVSYDVLTLKHDSLVDHTSTVSSAGEVSISLGSTNGTTHQVFAFYQKLTGHRNVEFTANASDLTGTIFDNGSFTVDHYSAAGAMVTIKFWEEYVLTDAAKDLIKRVGNYGWEDSIEVTANISWSRTMASRFEQLHGYIIKQYLPLFIPRPSSYGSGDEATSSRFFQCILDNPDQGAGYVNDFHTALQAGYREYVQTFANWTASELGLQYSAQPSYNLPMDMLASIPEVNAPECESLGFADNVDTYRLFSGVAQLAGKRVVSNELGAQFDMAYRYPIPALLFSANRAFAGGVNRFVIHGQSYTGEYYATTWPGYTAFNFLFSESWSETQPSWDHGFADAMEYLARMQSVQQMGAPWVDVAVYHKESSTTISQVPDSKLAGVDDLIVSGWSYSYISPDNFGMSQAVVENGILGPSGPTWKALVVYDTENLTVDALQTLSKYASRGLPILFSGGLPGYYPTGNGSSEDQFQSELSTLLTFENVYNVSSGTVASHLPSIGLSPRVGVKTNGTWYSTFREGSDGTDYVFVFSDLVASTGDITVQTTKTPYYYNAWTGVRSPVFAYESDGASFTIPLSLAGNQTVLLAFSSKLSSEVATPSFHVTSRSPHVIGHAFNNATNTFSAHIATFQDTDTTITTSSGKSTTISGLVIPAAISLTNWTLVAEHWEAPSNMSDASAIASKRNTTHTLDTLMSWTEIPTLVNTSGIGYYTTRLTWPPAGSSNQTLGAYLSISTVLHTARVYVNGARTQPVDPSNAVVDISSFLRTGVNEITVEVSTVMWNYLSSILGEIKNAGAAPLLLGMESLGIPLPPKVDVGLVGEVVITPFLEVEVQG